MEGSIYAATRFPTSRFHKPFYYDTCLYVVCSSNQWIEHILAKYGKFFIFYRQMESKDFRVNTVAETWRWTNLRNGIWCLWYWRLLKLSKGHVMTYHAYAFWFRKVSARQLYIVLSRYLATTSAEKTHERHNRAHTKGRDRGCLCEFAVSLKCYISSCCIVCSIVSY